MKLILTLSLKFILLLVGIIVIYVTLAAVLTWIPSNGSYLAQDEGIQLFVKSNGVHTDIVVPVRNEVYDWRTKLDTGTYKQEKKLTQICFYRVGRQRLLS